MKYIRTKDEIFELVKEDGDWLEIISNFGRKMQCHCVIKKHAVIKQADTIEELCDEIVLIENGNEHNIVYLQEAYDRVDEYHEQGNYEPRLIGRIKVGLDKKAVAECFIPNPNKLPMVNHKDGNTENNNVSNLEWVSAKENVEHSIKVLHRQDRYKDACYKQHLVKLGEDFKQKHGIELAKFLEDERDGKISWCRVEV